MHRFGKMLVLLCLLCSLLAAQQTATTSVPNLIRYSGTLKNVQGTASVRPATVGVTFAIYKEQEGGAPIWQETQNVTLEANGQYSVLLGSSASAGMPDDLFSQKEDRWLGVQVQDQEEQARVMLVSVPYAFKAHEADTLGGLPASAFMQVEHTADSAGALADGTAVNALSSAIGGGNNAVTKGKNSPSTPCSTPAGVIPYWNTAGNLCPSMLFQRVGGVFNGYIGVGNTNPSTQLDVTGAINVSRTAVNNSSTGNYQILENPVLGIGYPAQLVVPTNQNTYVGLLAGAQGFNQDPGTGDTGTSDTFVGYNAGFHNQTGSQNTAVGALAGYRNDNGSNNTFLGVDADFGVFGVALNNDTIVGYQAGFQNTASNTSIFGYQAGYNNTADGNSFFGYQAGYDTTTGPYNTYVGYSAGAGNAAGGHNTAVGYWAGGGGGNSNVSVGYLSGIGGLGSGNVVLGDHSDLGGAGSNNVIIGVGAAYDDGVGDNNTFIGANVDFNSQGQNNDIFIGANTGTQGSLTNDIYLGASCAGCDLDHPENNTIRVGTEGLQTDAYMAGVWGSTSDHPNQPVCVDANGKLFSVASGCDTTSSRRLKDEIADMGDRSSKLFQLRPVTFFYKPGYDDGTHQLQYGLIAEDVAKVYPEMVAFDKDGQPSGLRYQMLAPMLLNELQKEHAVVMAQQEELQSQLQQIKLQREQIDNLDHQMQLQTASLQERLEKLESAIAPQLQTASSTQPASPAATTGGLQ